MRGTEPWKEFQAYLRRLHAAALQQVPRLEKWEQVKHLQGYLEVLEDILQFDDELEARIEEIEEEGNAT